MVKELKAKELESGMQNKSIGSNFISSKNTLEELKFNSPQEKLVKKILVVDDEQSISSLASRVLLRGGYEVVTASNGEEALELYKKGGIDLVITDLNMPKLDGYGLFNQLKLINPEINICLMSGNIPLNQDKIDEMLKNGAKKIIPKPFEITELDAAVASAFSED